MLNAITIDLEDWAQSVLDPSLAVTDRVVGNVARVLDLLAAHNLRATFFALGKVCEKFPGLLPAIAEAGHEIGSHGYGHELVYNLTPERFEEDVQRSVDIITAQVGRRPAGYRAPAFSITSNSMWAVPILSKLGFRYSSSVFPIHGRRYGLPDSPRQPFRWPGSTLIEFPLSTVRIGTRNVPMCGGGYTRLLPGPLLASAVRWANAQGQPVVLYVHPYELAAGEVQWFRRQGVPVSWQRRITQELWRSRVPHRLTRLFREFPFGAMEQALCEHMPRAIELPDARTSLAERALPRPA